MMIAPIIFGTVVVGIAKMGDMKSVGRIGGRGGLIEVEERLDHERNLVFSAAAIRSDELLDLQRFVEGDR